MSTSTADMPCVCCGTRVQGNARVALSLYCCSRCYDTIQRRVDALDRQLVQMRDIGRESIRLEMLGARVPRKRRPG